MTRYPITESIPPEERDAEIQQLAHLKSRPPLFRFLGYLKLAGPGFMDSALTLGAGTLTAAMLSGATFGYKTMWLLWVAMGLGVFMMAAMARFTCRGGFPHYPGTEQTPWPDCGIADDCPGRNSRGCRHLQLRPIQHRSPCNPCLHSFTGASI